MPLSTEQSTSAVVPTAPLAQRRPQRSAVRHGQASCADYGCTRTECRQAALRARRQRRQDRLHGIPARVPPYAAARGLSGCAIRACPRRTSPTELACQ
jgi:hypothetical protein